MLNAAVIYRRMIAYERMVTFCKHAMDAEEAVAAHFNVGYYSRYLPGRTE
jgi:hypothetical protein